MSAKQLLFRDQARQCMLRGIAILTGGGGALRCARAVLASRKGPNRDQDCGPRIAERALEEPLRRIGANAGDELPVVLGRVGGCDEPAFGYHAATGEYGDMLAMRVIDPAKGTRLALHHAASIAGPILTTDRMVAEAPAATNAGRAARDSAAEAEY